MSLCVSVSVPVSVCLYVFMCVCLFLSVYVCVCVFVLNHWLCEWPHSNSLQNSKHKSHTALQTKCPQRDLAEFTWKQQLVSGVVLLLILWKESPGEGVWRSLLVASEKTTTLMFTSLYRSQSSLLAVCGRSMQARRKNASPKQRKRSPQGTSPSVLKKVGNHSSVPRAAVGTEAWVFLRGNECETGIFGWWTLKGIWLTRNYYNCFSNSGFPLQRKRVLQPFSLKTHCKTSKG